MYDPASHAVLNELLDDLPEPLEGPGIRHFTSRLGANFYSLHQLYQRLYGHRDDAERGLQQIVHRLVHRFRERAQELVALDLQREADPAWFLHQRWVAMALYVDGFADDLGGVCDRLDYFDELGVNVLHLMPLLRCPPGAADGGYAVSDFEAIDPRLGTMDQLHHLAAELRRRGHLLVLDVVLNHTSDQHAWARRARAGERRYRDFYYTFPDRTVPDEFEATMSDVFPETSPGSFTYDEALGRWVMSVFHDYQWDLDYHNPEVFVAMLDVLLFWANQGADVLRLDAVAFIWKRLGTSGRNLPEAHLLLQLFRDCVQVVAPGTLFIAEAIVAPTEVIRYFGEDALAARECDIAYNATVMALLWDAMATGNARVLSHGLRSLPDKLPATTWLNYARCHDDIGLGFDDADVRDAGYDPGAHRHFLVQWYAGDHPWSTARGARFGTDPVTGDTRITGALASLVGLEAALEEGDAAAIDRAVDRVLLLHAIILSFGGIPLLYYGDELGTRNDYDYLDDPDKRHDSRWLNRPTLTDAMRARRHEEGTVEQRIFTGLRSMIAARKALPAFADHDDRQLLDLGDEHVLAYLRHPPAGSDGRPVLVLVNFSLDGHAVHLADAPGLPAHARFAPDAISGEQRVHDGHAALPGTSVAWLPLEGPDRGHR